MTNPRYQTRAEAEAARLSGQYIVGPVVGFYSCHPAVEDEKRTAVAVFDLSSPRPCPLCGAVAVVPLPPALLVQQSDGTTHVCFPAAPLNGCNHGFAAEPLAAAFYVIDGTVGRESVTVRAYVGRGGALLAERTFDTYAKGAAWRYAAEPKPHPDARQPGESVNAHLARLIGLGSQDEGRA